MRALSEALEAPDPQNLGKFLGRLPTIFNVVIFSPHGYFGQSDVLGLPDTGGQVCISYSIYQILRNGPKKVFAYMGPNPNR